MRPTTHLAAFVFALASFLLAREGRAAPPAATCTRDGAGAGLMCTLPASGHSFTLPLSSTPCKPPAATFSLGDPGSPTANCEAAGNDYLCTSKDALKPGVFSVQGFACGDPGPGPLVVTLERPKPDPGGGGQQGADVTAAPYLPGDVWAAAMGELRIDINKRPVGNYYSSWSHQAVVFVDADAAPYFPMLDTIDESDDLFVVVVDRAARLDQATVSVQGCNRPPVEPRVYGSIPQSVLTAGGGAPPPAPPAGMTYIIRAFGKCAGATSGGPQVTVKRKDQSQQTLTVPVNPVYRFAIGASVAYDTTSTRTFSVQTATGDTVPRVAESEDQLGLTSLIYASFYLFARDFRKADLAYWYQRPQVFVGLDPRDFGRYLVAGAGVELTQGLSLLVGWRALSKQPVLQEGTGLQVGSSLQGTTVPTRDRWETGGFFIGLGLGTDLLSRFK